MLKLPERIYPSSRWEAGGTTDLEAEVSVGSPHVHGNELSLGMVPLGWGHHKDTPVTLPGCTYCWDSGWKKPIIYRSQPEKKKLNAYMKKSSCFFNLTYFSGLKHKINQVRVGEKATGDVFGMENLLGFVGKAVTVRNGGVMNESPIHPFVVFWGAYFVVFVLVFFST